jgi:tripartite-type tricarboxylate transporter receptor subunit TctC
VRKLVNFANPRTWWVAVVFGTMAACALGVLAHVPARADSGYPDRPVRIIVPYGPGGVADVTMRIVAQKLGERLGQQFIVENRPGAGAIIAAQAGLSAPPDGYTLSMTGNNHAISASLFKTLPYDTLRDFAPISTTTFFDILMATRAGSPLKTVQDVVAAARADPAHFNFGTVAPGSTQNLAVRLFKMVTDLPGSIVIYRTTPELLSGVLRGDVDVTFDYYAALQGPIVDHKLTVIATAGAERAPLMPDVPTVMESGIPDYEVTSWNGLSAPAGTPGDVIALLNREINATLQQPDVQAKTRQVGVIARGSTPEEMHERTKADIAKWTALIETSGLARQ